MLLCVRVLLNPMGLRLICDPYIGSKPARGQTHQACSAAKLKDLHAFERSASCYVTGEYLHDTSSLYRIRREIEMLHKATDLSCWPCDASAPGRRVNSELDDDWLHGLVVVMS